MTVDKKIVTIIFILLTSMSWCRAQVNIWENTNVRHRVELTPYLVKKPSSPAVIICPGGSYFWHDMENEGSKTARWLNGQGISAFVLRYRTAYVPAFVTHFRLLFRGNRHPDALNDLRQSMRYVRSHASQFRIDSTKIGVMGFSAGGHLAMCSVELLPRKEWPAFVVSVYPVVSFVDPCVHKRSRRGLLGDSRTCNKTLCEALSMERHVPQGCPPVFLINCKDDPIVHPHNAELLDSALTTKGVPHVYIQYHTGGHGFGASEEKGSVESRQWKNALIGWLKTIKIL
ncbi:endo-1,4-beta-xylanase [Hallella multisaccharivorax DSM 17128]|uniref:Esterase/lipase-like protein n=1 Tax=Hallella multisaccharivorax DSM 17128 TaxID=688246 RepID=F8N5Q0_9BACT|nr:esterase/lipase-like protein [Hallella multisaccharivorax DSM 17128]GJG31698.1 endo-1,4-beta-xylanase [Hallella multisaccharivorax DSM 17128]